MKKLFFAAAVVMAAVVMTSCDGGTPKAKLRTDVDSLSYALGVVQSEGLERYLVERLGIDTAYIGQFIKGLNDGANAGEDKRKAAYYAGIQIGQQISNQLVKGANYEIFGEDTTKTISLKNFMAGFVRGTTGKKGLMSTDEAKDCWQRLMTQVKERQMKEQYSQYKAEGEKFLEENAKKEGVNTLEGGVQYKVLKEGDGTVPSDTSTVVVHYEGRTLDGNVFDSSYARNTPLETRANQVIKGWGVALSHMPAGSTWEVYIPQEMAYGARPQQHIKPFSVLIFKMELLEVK